MWLSSFVLGVAALLSRCGHLVRGEAVVYIVAFHDNGGLGSRLDERVQRVLAGVKVMIYFGQFVGIDPLVV